MVRVKGGSEYQELIQGANSDKLKFAKVLCATCNNARSQRFDRAYEAFAAYLHTNENAVTTTGTFRLSSIYGSNWRNDREELARYFIKNVCCRLAEDRALVPPRVVDFLDGTARRLFHLNLEMGINLAKQEAFEHLKDVHGLDGGSLWTGEHLYVLSPDGQSAIGTRSHFGFDWFNLDYEFKLKPVRGKTNFSRWDRVVLTRFWPHGTGPGFVASACKDCNVGSE